MLADLYGIEAALLQDESALAALLVTALKTAGFTILETQSHKFRGGGGGVTAIALLTESHAGFHTYPERQYMALDIFSCGQNEPRDVLAVMAESLRPEGIDFTMHERGSSA